jgi:ubiquinone/menaquinone biosynthesis C-methylase UbiE
VTSLKIITDARNEPERPPKDVQTIEVLREWRESALYWQKHIATIRTMFDPVTQALIEEAGIVEGYSVLDVAGGSGEPSLTIAETVGPTGSVTCTDAVAEMVAGAQGEAQRRGLTNVAFQQCVADSLPFDSNSFDATVSRLGVMFFPDPLASLREMLRVTKSGGAVSLAVWDKSELNPFSYVISDVVSRHFDSQPADPNTPGAFRFAEAGTLAQILKTAGANDVNERVLQFQIAAPISPKEFWEMRSETSGTLREKLAKLPRHQADLISKEVQEATKEFFPNDQMRIPAQMIIVTGKKSEGSEVV